MFLTNKEKGQWLLLWVVLLFGSAVLMSQLFHVQDAALYVLTFLIESAMILVFGAIYYTINFNETERFKPALWVPRAYDFKTPNYEQDNQVLSELLTIYYSRFVFDDLGNEKHSAQEDLNRGNITLVSPKGETFEPNVRCSQGEGVSNLFNKTGFIDPKFQPFLETHAYQKMQGYAVTVGTLFSGHNSELSIHFDGENPFQKTHKANQYRFTQNDQINSYTGQAEPFLQVQLENEYRDISNSHEYFEYPLNFILKFTVKLTDPNQLWSKQNPVLIQDMQFEIENGNQTVPNNIRSNYNGPPESYDVVVRRFLLQEVQQDYARKQSKPNTHTLTK